MNTPDEKDASAALSQAQIARLLELGVSAAGADEPVQAAAAPAEPPPRAAVVAALAVSLAQPIDVLCRQLKPSAARTALAGALAGGGAVRTVADLLAAAQPSAPLLEALKQDRKAARRASDDAAEQAAATAVYYAAIAAALLRCGARISELSDAELAGGFAWSAHELRDLAGLRGLMEEAAARVRASGGGSS